MCHFPHGHVLPKQSGGLRPVWLLAGFGLKTVHPERLFPRVCFPPELQSVHQSHRRRPQLCLHASPVLTPLLPSLTTIPATELAIIMKTGLNSDRDHYV